MDDDGNTIFKADKDTGQISISIKNDDKGILNGVVDKNNFNVTYTDANGKEISGIYFDFENSQFAYNGSGHFTGSLNVNDNFIVDENGNTTLKSAELYKGSPDDGDYVRMYLTESGVSIMRGLFESSIRIIAGRVPQIEMISGNSAGVSVKIITNYINGMWLGNGYCDIDDDGKFLENEDSNGLFIDEEQGEVFVVNAGKRKKLYTGDAVAIFG